MKTLHLITIGTIALLSTACTTSLDIKPIINTQASQNSQPTKTISISETLLAGKWQAFNTAWRGNDGKPPVLQLENGNIRLTNGCNSLWTDYYVANGRLVVSDAVRSTRMACDDKLMQIDDHISSLLRQGKFDLVQMNGALILQIHKDNIVYWFIKE